MFTSGANALLRIRDSFQRDSGDFGSHVPKKIGLNWFMPALKVKSDRRAAQLAKTARSCARACFQKSVRISNFRRGPTAIFGLIDGQVFQPFTTPSHRTVLDNTSSSRPLLTIPATRTPFPTKTSLPDTLRSTRSQNQV